MTYGEMSVEQMYFHNTAWEEIRLAYSMMQQGRKAKAQKHTQEARYYAAKVPAEFTEPDLIENIDRISKLVYG